MPVAQQHLIVQLTSAIKSLQALTLAQQNQVMQLAIALAQVPALLLYRHGFWHDLLLLEQLALSRQQLTIVVPFIVTNLNLPVPTQTSVDLAEVQRVLATLSAELQDLVRSFASSFIRVQQLTKEDQDNVTIITKIMKENDYIPKIDSK